MSLSPDSLPLPADAWDRLQSLSREEPPTIITETLGATGVGLVLHTDLLGGMPDWQEQALCSQSDPETFFPERGASPRAAKLICARCTVKSECADYALSRGERFGVWGGLSERERRRLKRRST